VLGVVVGTTIGTGEITDPGVVSLLGSGFGLLLFGSETPLLGVDEGVGDSVPELVPFSGVAPGSGVDSVDGVVVELLVGVVDSWVTLSL
jgi:hypothetical protein